MEEKFRKGVRVVKARPYSDTKYCKYGGDKHSVPIGTRGKIVSSSFPHNSLIVIFDNDIEWEIDKSELDLESYFDKKHSKTSSPVQEHAEIEDTHHQIQKTEFFVGDAFGQQIGKYLKTEEDLKEDLKKITRKSSHTERIIGYKLTPIYEGKLNVICKAFKLPTIKKIKKKSHRR